MIHGSCLCGAVRFASTRAVTQSGIPGASREAAIAMRHEADAFLCSFLPSQRYSVGQWYEDFSQTTDAEVLELLRRAQEWTPARRAAEAAEGASYA